MKTLEQTNVISVNDRELLCKVKEIVRKHQPAATVLLYGSVARGTKEPESDYDILVLTDEHLATDQENVVRYELYDLELDNDAVISTQFYPKDQWDTPLYHAMPFHQRVDRDAVLL